jgi:hypothetical protein
VVVLVEMENAVAPSNNNKICHIITLLETDTFCHLLSSYGRRRRRKTY